MRFETRKMVAFDLDDVLADFMTPFVELAAKIHSRPELSIMQPVDWEWSNLGMSRDQQDAVWEVIHSTEGFWENLPIIDGVNKDLVKEVVLKTNTVFPTARAYAPGGSVAFQSAMFLRRNFGIMFPTVIVGNDKGPLAAALKYDYFIDDRPKNVLEVKSARPECKVFLKDASHNQPFSHPEIPRIASANEFCEMILKGE